MKAIDWSIRRLNLDTMIRSREFNSWIGDKLGNGLCLEDAERFDRLQKYSKDGSDGSTHYEVLMDWEEFLDNLRLPKKVADRISNEIATCYAYHESKGTLHQVIG